MTVEAAIIRQFQPKDAAECCRILRSCIAEDPQLPWKSKEELLRAETPEFMCRRASCFYMAVYLFGDAISALGGIELNEIRLLYVTPERWRRGIGSSLLAHLESWVPPALFGDVFVYAAPGAVDFYRSQGYEPGGEQAFVVGSDCVPTVFMTKKLSQEGK